MHINHSAKNAFNFLLR